MTSPVRELHAALYSVLSVDAPLMDIATAVYDRVPESAEFPYVSFGPVNSVPRDAECITASEHTMQIDTWSRVVGSGEGYDMTNAVKRAIQSADLSLTVNALVALRVVSVRNFDDPDGLTEHGVVTIQATIEER